MDVSSIEIVTNVIAVHEQVLSSGNDQQCCLIPEIGTK